MEKQGGRLEKRVSILSVIMVVSIFCIKFVTAFYTNSLSFLAEFTDSILDIVVVSITLWALRKSRKPADADHMFGHYKANSFAGLIESLLTVGLYLYISYKSVRTLLELGDYEVTKPLVTILSLIIVIVINLIISTIIARIGRTLNNATIKAQGVNFRGDLYRNIAVIIGMIFAYFEISIIDPILAIGFALISIYQAGKVIQQSYNELMDYSAIDPDAIHDAKSDILEIEFVKEVESVAVKTAGNNLDAHVRVLLDRNISNFEIEQIASEIKALFSDRFPEYAINVIVEIGYSPDDSDGTKFDTISDIVRKCALKLEMENQLHEFSADILQDQILIQFHINVLPDSRLGEAHDRINELEQEIDQQLRDLFPSKTVAIVSHIEPIKTRRKIHHHNGDIDDGTETVTRMHDVIGLFVQENEDVRDGEVIRVLEEPEGTYVTARLVINENVSIKQSHLLSEMLEVKMMAEDPAIVRCTIHTEPK